MHHEDIQAIIDFYELGEPTQSYPVSEQTLDKYRDILPPRLLDIWQQDGFCQFQNGLYYIVNPEDWQDVVDVWLEGTEFAVLGRFYAISRTGFGELKVYHPETGTAIKIHTIKGIISGSIRNLQTAKEKEIGIEVYITKGGWDYADFKIGENGTPMFKKARKKLGGLEQYEMYAFEPAYRLLESMQMLPTLDNLVKLDARVHMLLLRDIIDKPTIWVFNTTEMLKKLGYLD